VSDKIKKAFVVKQKDDFVLPEKHWDQVPEGVVRALQINSKEIVKFVGHAHFGGRMRSVFERVDGNPISKDSLEFLREQLSPLGTVNHPSEKEYDIASRCKAAPNPKEIS
jgi:hypothetical protein